MRTGPSTPKIAEHRASASNMPARRSISQIPTELASSATSRRRSELVTSALAAASSSSVTTEAASWVSTATSSSVHACGIGS
jgi:hypothetical protein